MQPTNDDPQRSEPATGWLPSDTGNWAAPSYASAASGATVTKARPWLTAIVSFVTLLILIAALGNQWVTDSIARHANAGTFGDHLAHSVNQYAWRFSAPSGGDLGHVWVGNLANVGAVLILTLLLVPVVCRGKGGFWQAFFGAWFTVVVATLLGTYARAAVVDMSKLPGYAGQGKPDQVLFSSISPGAATAFVALAFGLVVGLAAGVTAVMTRRTEVIAPQPVPTFGAPWTRDDEPDQSWQAAPAPLPGPTVSPSPWSGSDTDRTPDAGGAPERPAADDSGEHTAVLPAVDRPAQEQRWEQRSDTADSAESADSAERAESADSAESADTADGGDAQATTQFPRNTAPPDDDETGPRHSES
jgi:hypothetical protein